MNIPFVVVLDTITECNHDYNDLSSVKGSKVSEHEHTSSSHPSLVGAVFNFKECSQQKVLPSSPIEFIVFVCNQRNYFVYNSY